MNKTGPKQAQCIHSKMTVLDIIHRYRQTEAVFRKYDEQAGECICCQALFDPLKDVVNKYDLDLERLLADLEAAANMG